jgi:hypothetical protein
MSVCAQSKLNDGVYRSVDSFLSDIRQVLFHPRASAVPAQRLLAFLLQIWAFTRESATSDAGDRTRVDGEESHFLHAGTHRSL